MMQDRYGKYTVLRLMKMKVSFLGFKKKISKYYITQITIVYYFMITVWMISDLNINLGILIRNKEEEMCDFHISRKFRILGVGVV